MKRLMSSLLAIAIVPQLGAVAQPPPDVPYLAATIADGAPFLVRLNPSESNGTLIGGETYFGQFDRASGTYTVSGLARRPEDGLLIRNTATYGGDPMRQEISLWGATYSFDSRGNLFQGPLGGRLAGKVWLSK